MILTRHPRLGFLSQEAPGSFAALMDLYERNYIDMRRLLPDMPPPATALVSKVTGGLDLHLRVIECNRYTSDLNLTYRFREQNGAILNEPDLHVRIYHDARQAEVMAAQLRHYAVAFSAEADAGCSTNPARLRHRWQINRFLYKWLTYCLRQGHRFSDSHLYSR
ncbi:MAG: DUF1249 domain-containing protein [Candidatus Competibacteraceae bacterium]|nr:MAG: DUF1249 domain-containing protein [Candidatus Competibacteraceae bacterium]